MKMRRNGLTAAVIITILMVLSGFGVANSYPPAPSAGNFYGDADGNLIITLADQTQHTNFILLKANFYDTLQPISAKSDTCDVDSGTACTLADLTHQRNVILLKPVVIGDKPWVISNAPVGGLPSSVAASSSAPFQVSLASTKVTQVGRAGLPVVATIESGSGTLNGRDCAPVAGTRDQPVTGQTCALSVTVTDWATDAALGLTETGATGFTFNAPASGDTRILFTVFADARIDIPLTTISFVVTATGAPSNTPPVVTSTCSTSASEGAVYTCTLTATDADVPAQALTWGVTGSDTCGGAIIAGVYTWTPSEAQGGTSCVVGVGVTDDGTPPTTTTQDTPIPSITETTSAPVITSSCSTAASEGAVYTCTLTATDSDVPAESLTWGVTGSDTCGGVIIAGVYTWTPSEAQGGTSCVVGVGVTDDGTPPTTTTQDTTIPSITETTSAPVITSSCSTAASEGAVYTCTLTATDSDVPAELLTWAVTGSDTCGGVIIAGVYTWTPSEAQGGTSCVVGVGVTDDGTPPTTTTQDTTIPGITESYAPPSISVNCPAGTGETTATTCSVIVSDSDVPAQTLTCSFNPATTCLGVLLTGCSQVDVPAQGEASGPGVCVVAVDVNDTIDTASASDSIAIDEENQNPSVTVSCGSIGEDSATTCGITATDGDLPAQTVSCNLDILNTTCSGVTLTGCATANVPAQGESSGPGSCVVAVEAVDSYLPSGVGLGSGILSITEVNTAPSIALTCPASVTTGNPIACTIGTLDGDVPANTLNCSLAGDDTCGGVLTGCSSYDLATSTASCRVSVDVADNGVPVLTDNDFADVTVSGGSQTVSIDCTSPGPNPVDELSTIVCAVTATNGTPTIDAGTDTCGGTLSGAGPWTYSRTPTEAQGPGTCVAGVINGTATATASVTINEVNVAPTWTTAPVSITTRISTAYSRVNGVASDSDLPNASAGDPGYLTCSTSGSTCGFAVTATGTGAGAASCTVAFTGPATPTSCTVNIVATDGYGQSVSQNITITVGRIWFVDNTATGSNNGTSWANGYTTIQAALTVALTGDQIWVKQGTYSNGTVTSLGVMLAGQEMYGGFTGNEYNFAQRDWKTNATVLDGLNISRHLIEGATNATIDGFTIRNGNANGGGNAGKGGGILANAIDNFTIRNMLFQNNTATSKGGAIFCFQASINVANSIFTGNSSAEGGAIYNDNQSANIISDTIYYNNTATANGGAEANKNNRTSGDTRANVLYISNSASVNGGGQYNEGSVTGMSNVTFSLNSAASGGGIYNKGGSPTIVNGILWGNIATTGPEYFNNVATMTITYSDVQGGYAGVGNINSNPLFVTGPGAYNGYYLSQIAAGQGSTSPCVDTGSATAASLGFSAKTTRTDLVGDAGTVDMGYHYVP